MNKRIGFSIVAFAVMIALARTIPQVQGAEDIKSEIETANKALCDAFAASDAAAMAACYTADAQVFPTGMDIVSGTAAIEAFWKGAMGGPVKTIALITTEVEQHGDTVNEVGRAEFFDTDGNKLDTAKYIVIWKRIDGKWKLHRDIFNSNTPAS